MQFTGVSGAQVKGKKFFQHKGEATHLSCNCNHVLRAGLHYKYMHETDTLAVKPNWFTYL